MLLFLLSQSTINPVDAVYQPSPLEQPVISAMPSQTVIPPGTEEKFTRNIHQRAGCSCTVHGGAA